MSIKTIIQRIFCDHDYKVLRWHWTHGDMGNEPLVMEAHIMWPQWVHNYGDFQIDTLEGKMTASVGDYIIKGIKGEFYACKPDVFEQTYDPVEE